MRNRNLIFLLGAILLIGIASAIPQTFNIHTRKGHKNLQAGGKLTNSGGSALTGSYIMNFTIYDDVSAGNPLWSSGNQSISMDSDGIYNFILVDIDLDFSEQYYVNNLNKMNWNEYK